MNMRESMNKYAVQWSEGMLLAPQHFQQNEIYWSRQLLQRTSLIQPFYWGLDTLQIDEARLTAGEVCIRKLRAVFEDGLLVDYDAEIDKDPLLLNLKQLAGDRKGIRIKVFANVPVRTAGAASEQTTRRFLSIEGGKAVDENTGDDEVAISRLKPVLSLSGERPNDFYTSLPLLEVDVRLDGSFPLTAYVPPLLKLSAFSEVGSGNCLQRRLGSLLNLIRTKAIQLADITGGKEEFTGSLVNEHHSRVIRQLVSGLPSLEVLCQSGMAHPFDVFERLAALSGQLCSIGKSTVPPLPSRYNHADLAPGFEQVLEFSRQVVDEISLAYTSIPLTEQEDGTYSITFEKGWLDRHLLLEVGFPGGYSEEQRMAWIKGAKIGSSSVLKTLADRRLSGAQLVRVGQDANTGLVAKPDSLLFQLKDEKLVPEDDKSGVIKPGQKLYVKGAAGKLAPIYVVLHVTNVSVD